MRIHGRKHERQCPGSPVIARMCQRRRHFLSLFIAQILASYKSSINHPGIFGVGRYVAIFVACRDRAPIVKSQRSIISPARRRDRAAILLRAIHPIGKPNVSAHVVHLSGWLVIPRAPGFAAVTRDDGSLIASQNHSAGLIRVDPQLVVIVAARSALERNKRFPSVA